MLKRMICIGLALATIVSACGQKESGDKGPLVGNITMETVYGSYPRFRQVADGYEPDPGIVRALGEVDRTVTCLVFLGTWCSDSEEHVPPFDRLISAAANPNIGVTYYGVDRQKDDGTGLAERFGIEYVPTFVVLEGGEEIGRIVETPTVTIGEDLITIIEGER